jgi:hypothetical protein
LILGILNWDRGKSLWKNLVSAFLKSSWPPGDLAIAIPDRTLLTKTVKVLRRHKDGEKFLRRMIQDLRSRNETISQGVLSIVSQAIEEK